jgi:1-deoxy-D-xylulose-5-phosphate reductoisomerase
MTLHSGEEGLLELVSLEADAVLCATVGMSGLRPVMRAMETGKDIALATKEVLVAAGEFVMRERERLGRVITPVDSEHSAIFQCLQSSAFDPYCVRRAGGRDPAEDSIRRLILTASGGPFAFRPELDFDKVTVADALNHPKWKMGRKITIDSATMMNKGLEIIEARWLFNIPPERIDVLVHPESIVHSLVEFTDGTQLAELSEPDMTFAINYALSWPKRLPREEFGFKPPLLDLAASGALRFHKPDPERFPALRLAREAVAAGGTATAVLNGANEVAVEAFLEGRIRFSAIWGIVGDALAAAPSPSGPVGLGEIFDADAWARDFAARRCAG